MEKDATLAIHRDLRKQRAAILAGRSSMREIIDRVAEETGVPITVILSDRQQRPAVMARHLAIYRAACEGFTVGMICTFFGRDHTSVSYAVRKLERQAANTQPSPRSTRFISTRSRLSVVPDESSEKIRP